jgi:hypothetical protein
MSLNQPPKGPISDKNWQEWFYWFLEVKDEIIAGGGNPRSLFSLLSAPNVSSKVQELEKDVRQLKKEMLCREMVESGYLKVEDNDTVAPAGKVDGYLGVAYISSQGRLYFLVNNNTRYYVTGTLAAEVRTGQPIGLLLALTYQL